MKKKNNRSKNEYSQQLGIKSGLPNSNTFQISENDEIKSQSVRLDQSEGKVTNSQKSESKEPDIEENPSKVL